MKKKTHSGNGDMASASRGVGGESTASSSQKVRECLAVGFFVGGDLVHEVAGRLRLQAVPVGAAVGSGRFG